MAAKRSTVWHTLVMATTLALIHVAMALNVWVLRVLYIAFTILRHTGYRPGGFKSLLRYFFAPQ